MERHHIDLSKLLLLLAGRDSALRLGAGCLKLAGPGRYNFRHTDGVTGLEPERGSCGLQKPRVAEEVQFIASFHFDGYLLAFLVHLINY